mgnify:CR=1 FL=1
MHFIARMRALAQGKPSHLHQHAFAVHAHSGLPSHVHIGTWTLARRPLIIGAIHGLAGSGALTSVTGGSLEIYLSIAPLSSISSGVPTS